MCDKHEPLSYILFQSEEHRIKAKKHLEEFQDFIRSIPEDGRNILGRENPMVGEFSNGGR